METPISMYVELDLDFLGIVVPKVGVLITQEPNELLDTCHKTKLPGVVDWNLIKLAYKVFVKNYGVLFSYGCFSFCLSYCRIDISL